MFRLLIRNKHNNKRGHACRRTGFTLIELLVYLAIFAIAAGLLSGILAVFVRVQSQEAAGAELTQQLSFVQSTIQRLVREAVNIQNQSGPDYASSTLILRMASPSLDPTIIFSDANAVYLRQGTGAVNPLTSSRVRVASFQVVKYENPGAHAIVQLDFSLTYNSQRAYQQITRGLKTAIGRVTAANFDDSLLPNTVPNSFTIGNPTYPWKSLTLSNILNLGQLTDDPQVGIQNGSIYYNSVDNAFRGYKSGAWADLGGAWAASSTNIYNTNSGNVGIGTLTPGSLLTVVGTTHLRGSATGTLGLYVSGSGLVGIGAVDPQALLHLRSNVPGVLFFDTDVALGVGNPAWRVRSFDGGSFNIQSTPDYSAYTDQLVVNSSGNVGIGTTAPLAKLDIRTPSDTIQLLLADRTTDAGTKEAFIAVPSYLNAEEPVAIINARTESAANHIYIGGNDNTIGIENAATSIRFLTAAAVNTVDGIERMRIDSNGYVGIGTTTPSSVLHVKGTSTTVTIESSSSEADIHYNTAAGNWQSGVDGNGFFIYDTAYRFVVKPATGRVGIGTVAPGYTLTVNGTAWVTSGAWSGSDIHWKKDITPLPLQGSLDKVMRLNPVSFGWRTDEFPDMHFSSSTQIGFIAQDVEKIIPEVVTTDNNGYKGMSYERITSMLTAAIQEQQKQIEELKNNALILNPGGGNVGIGTNDQGNYKLDVVGGKFRAAANTYDSGWFVIADNTAYTKTHNLGTSKVLINLYGATDASGSNMNSLGDVREYGGGFNGITVSNIGINSVDVRTASNTSAPQTRIWNGSSWVYPTYVRIVILALE